MKVYNNEILSKKIKRKNKIIKTIKTIFYIIMTLILIVSVSLIIQKIRKPAEIPSFFGYKAFVVASGSMEPTLDFGDIVIIRETEQNNINTGDIITFLEKDNNKSTITHRIVNIIEEDGKIKYQTKGDNNNTRDDELVTYDNIEGKYQFKISKLGRAILKLQNAIVIIIVFFIIYIICKVMEKEDNKKYDRHEKREEFEKKNDENNKKI